MKKMVFAALLFFLPLLAHARFFGDVRYAGDINWGYGTSTSTNGINNYAQRGSMGTVQGVSFSDYLQAGIGVDVNLFTHYFKKEEPYKSNGTAGFPRMSMNEFVDLRGKYPIGEKTNVLLDLGLGITHGIVHMSTNVAFFCQFGPGIQHKHFAFYTGLQAHGTGPGTVSWFAKIAYAF